MIFALILASYLVGSISTAIIVCRLLRLPDPRTQGSGNPGATNVLRVGGKKAALTTLGGDLLKGFLPTLLVHLLGYSDSLVALVGIAAFLGHLFPLYFGFRGGKGVATALGVLFGLNYIVGGLTVLSWIIVALVTRISSLSALIALLLAPVYYLWLNQQYMPAWILAIMTLLIFLQHRRNIRNLFDGKEPRIGQKP